MASEELAALRRLLDTQRVLSIAVAIYGKPAIGLMPFVREEDYCGALVLGSPLAEHTRGLAAGATCAVLIHEPDRPEADPHQLVRVALRGVPEVVKRAHATFEARQQRYLNRFPDSAQMLALSDFELFRLRFESGRLVLGFGRVVKLGGCVWAALRGQAGVTPCTTPPPEG
ncbi:MAG: hypothetical protein HYV63_15930 [Candidatus Schekmanbacteria bacterium]|nr:hypothetical protein [Candidatus Schekmanbacteria bacterium]